MKRRKLPIGIQTFREIREEDYYYVDKTALILRLAAEGKYYFLSRPRRFGKSLFLNTIAELFAANESLFRGLHVQDKWDWAKKFPVIRISFADGVLRSREDLRRRILDILRINRETLHLECSDTHDVPRLASGNSSAAPAKSTASVRWCWWTSTTSRFVTISPSRT